MPVINYIPTDPFDLVIQGEQFRSAGMMMPVSGMFPLIDDPPEDLPLQNVVLVAGEQNLLSMVGSYPVPNVEVLRSRENSNFPAANFGISTPTGALIPILPSQAMLRSSNTSTNTWTMTGVTRDSANAPLPSCRVVVLETGRININGSPVVGETTSDGSGNYSVVVPLNTAYQIIAYKPGSPDVAGITRSDVTPT